MSNATVQKRKPVPPSSIVGRRKRLLWYGVGIAFVLIVLIFSFAFHNISETRKSMEVELMQRQTTIAASRAEMTDAWLDSQVEKSISLVTSDLFQLYASEVDKLPGGVPLLFNSGRSNEPVDILHEDEDREQAERLSSQLPLMRNMLAEFAAKYGFDSASIVSRKAETYITTIAAMPSLGSGQRKFVADVAQRGKVVYAPLEVGPKGLNLEIYVPILPPSYRQQSSMPVAVLILSQRVDSRLAEILSPGVVSEKGRHLRLIQRNGDIYQNVVPGGTLLRQVSNFTVPAQEGHLSFALRKTVGGNTDVYSSGFRLRSTDWWLLVEHEASYLEGSLADKAKTIYILAGVISLALVLLISAVWWRLVGQEQCLINTEITNLLSVIEDQKKLLDGINSTMTDPISLTDGQGVYRYVNNAFSLAVGRRSEEVVGLDGPAVFGFDTAKRLNASDQHVLMTGESISITEVLWLQSKRYHFQISKTPLREAGTRTPQGIVSVFRDITQLVETQERSRRVVQQTIDALVRTIEEADPFLGGHSRIMGGIASLVAKQLRLAESDVATVEAAANLSQIGKMFVPRQILLKPGALTPEEKHEMERHVEYARNVLKGIEFDLPVVEAIYEMNERLDGGGYPRALTGEHISMHARVLAVANAFTAMAKPRSYRAALPVEEVLGILEQKSESYDQNVVAALKQVLVTPAGERLVQQAASVMAI